MKRLALSLLIILMLSTLSGCGPAPTPASRAAPPAPPAQPVEHAPVAEGGGNAAVAGAAAAQRMVIRTADLKLIVTDTANAQERIASLATGRGGYVADSSMWREGEQARGRLTVLVPAEQLDAFLLDAKKLAVRVETESLRSADVTEEFSDLNAQLVNLEATEKELRTLLADVREKTQKAEDVLQIYRELTSIRGEIERVKGRMQYLSTMTALATANIELIPDVLAQPVVAPGWRPLETLQKSGRALVKGLQGLVDLLIRLVVFVLPMLLLIAIPIYAVIWVLRWLLRRARRAAPARQTRSEPPAKQGS